MRDVKPANSIHFPDLVGKELVTMRDIRDAILRRASEIAWETYKQDYESMTPDEQETIYSRAIDEVREEVLAIGSVELAKRKELRNE